MVDNKSLFVVFGLILSAAILPVKANEQWIESSFQDFSDGKLDASGQNIYVTHRGDIRTIHRFDLNQDGFLDIMFNNTHDSRRYIPATLAQIGSEDTIEQSELAVQGSLKTVTADLNRDGFADLVFLPNESGVQAARRFLTIIYGGQDGWSQRRSNGVLPVNKATDITIADINGDRWPDIISLNTSGWTFGQPSGGKIVRVYWGSDQGYILTRYQDSAIKGATSLASSDFDEDGISELIVATSENKLKFYHGNVNENNLQLINELTIVQDKSKINAVLAQDINDDERVDLIVSTNGNSLFTLNNKGNNKFNKATEISAFPATHLSANDLDADGKIDLVLTNFVQNRALGGEATGAGAQKDAAIHILWGNTQWRKTDASALEVKNAVATAITDLNQDGHQDLAIAVHQGDIKYQTDSPFYYGNSQQKFVKAKVGVTTEGATDILVVNDEKSPPAKLIYANSLGGSVGELVPLQLFWGDGNGFSENNQWVIPFRSGYESSAADFNADGYVDLLAINTGHAGEISKTDPNVGGNIFWGAKSGFDAEGSRSVLYEQRRSTSTVADFNKDGYLDIVLGSFVDELPMTVHYGSAKGFSREGGLDIKGSKGRSAEPIIADFDQDSWLDIMVPVFHHNMVRFYNGSAEGFSQSSFKLDVPVPVGLDVADLNNDGYIDLVVSSYKDPVTNNRDTGLFVFWGSAQGYKQWNSQWLPSKTPIAPAIADFDSDGYLDIFAPNYHAELNRENLPNYLYWGGQDGFSANTRSSLDCDSGHDAQAGDFNRDGKLDIAVSCHASNGDHTTSSVVFYNDGQRFENPKRQFLLTHGAHWMWSSDMGHIYDRSWSQTYESSVFVWQSENTKGTIEAKVEATLGAQLTFEIKTAVSNQALAKAPWRAVNGDTFSVSKADNVLQYRANFDSNNGDNFPILSSVNIHLF